MDHFNNKSRQNKTNFTSLLENENDFDVDRLPPFLVSKLQDIELVLLY
jgi:hypothetical protein